MIQPYTRWFDQEIETLIYKLVKSPLVGWTDTVGTSTCTWDPTPLHLTAPLLFAPWSQYPFLGNFLAL